MCRKVFVNRQTLEEMRGKRARLQKQGQISTIFETSGFTRFSLIFESLLKWKIQFTGLEVIMCLKILWNCCRDLKTKWDPNFDVFFLKINSWNQIYLLLPSKFWAKFRHFKRVILTFFRAKKVVFWTFENYSGGVQNLFGDSFWH